MIIETKYRDIDFAEAVKCYRDGVVPEDVKKNAVPWSTLRGKSVSIMTPSTRGHHEAIICGGPFFSVVDDGPARIVCPHIAEIGD